MIKFLEYNFKNLGSKGFTLMELFAVIFIIGIISLIVVPTLRAYRPDLELSSSAQNLIGDFRYVQQMAVTEQIKYGINFFSTENKYQLIKYGITEEVVEEKKLPEKVSFQSISGLTDNKAVFNPYGAAQEAGTINLINTKGSIKIISIRPSGFVKIID
jgi:prepilin-type N-terminal cleavage/methylation domain-containing protein